MLDDDTLNSLSFSLRAGHYSLLLGAGVSLDSKNHGGHNLPTGNEFRLELCKLKGAHESSSLQRVYSTLTDQEIDSHVIGRFRKCTPGLTNLRIPKFLWNRVFTFNIDDALETAYETSSSFQKPLLFHFNDDYVENRDCSKLPIIHLHGTVRQPDKGFVFSRSEYVRQIKSINPWMVVLTQFLPVEPFIIAGTSLDEIDLEFYLSHRSQQTTRKDRGTII